jgi:hypothetical protein
MANIFANMKYDANLFYSKLIKEINPATAEDFSSLLFHSNIAGYEIEFAKPATFDISFIIPDIVVQSDQLITYTIKKNRQLLDIYGNNFTIMSDIEIYITGSNVYGKTFDENEIKYLKVDKVINPLNESTFVYLVTLDKLYQYKRDIYSFEIPDYAVGTTKQYTINVSKNNIYEIHVWYKPGKDTISNELIEYNLTELEMYNYESNEIASKFGLNKLNLKYTKHLSSSTDLDIFLNIKDDKIEFTLGDGYNGQKRNSGEILFIEIKTTNGAQGNIQTTEWLINNVLVTSENNLRLSNNSLSLKAISLNGGTGGKSFYNNEDLKRNLLKKIRNRDSIITLKDFEDYFEMENGKPFVDTKYFNSNSNVFIYNILRDFDNKILPTNTFNEEEVQFDQNLFLPEKTYNDIQMISPFFYKKRNNYYDAYLINPEVKISLKTKEDNKLLKLTNAVEIYITYDFILRKSKIVLKNYNASYTYIFSCNLFKMTLNKDNNFEQEISTLFTDEYCLINEELTFVNGYIKGLHNIKLDILNTFILDSEIPENTTSNDWTKIYLMNWYSEDSYFQTELKQQHYLYIEPDSYNPGKENRYVINLPYIEKYFFTTNDRYKVYNKLYQYFIVYENKNKFPFNTTVHQTFFNTIDIPTKYKKYLTDINNNFMEIYPKLQLYISIIIDKTKFSLSDFKTIEEVEDSLKLFLISMYSKLENFELKYFESYIENRCIQEYNVIKNIEIITPKTLTIPSSSEIFYNMEDDLGNTDENGEIILTIKDMIDFVPPYFHFDYDNINLEFILD